MNSFRDIITVWPTRREMALELGAGTTVDRVHKWHQRNHIPGEMDVHLVPALARRGVNVSFEQLARMRADRVSSTSGEVA